MGLEARSRRIFCVAEAREMERRGDASNGREVTVMTGSKKLR